MTLPPYVEPEGTEDAIEEFRTQLDRTVDYLRSLPLDRLSRSDSSGRSLAEVAHELSQQLADTAASLRLGEPDRKVPSLKPHAAGDQVAVTGYELVIAAQSALADPIPSLARASESCRELRVTRPT